MMKVQIRIDVMALELITLEELFGEEIALELSILEVQLERK